MWIAPTAAEALRILPLDPDLILMDIGLPDMDGLALTRLIRQTHPEVPIIAVTAHNLPEDRVRCLAAGCTDTISKPFPFQEMVGYLAEWQTTHPSHR